MNFSDVQYKHLILQSQYRRGELSLDAFDQKTQELYATDESGIYWRMKSDGSGWEKYVNEEWINDKPSFNTNDRRYYILPQSPSNTVQFLVQTAVNAVKAFKKKMITGAIVFGATFLFSLFLSFGWYIPVIGTLSYYLESIFGPSYKVIDKLFLSVALASFITWLIFKLKTKGLKQLLKQLGEVPKTAIDTFKTNKYSSLIIVAIAAGISLLFSFWSDNTFLAFMLFLCFYAVLSDWKTSKVVLFAALLMSDCKKIFRKNSPINTDTLILIFLGLSVGMLFSALLGRFAPIVSLIVSIILIAVSIVFIVLKLKTVK